jgi:hypothetical protein
MQYKILLSYATLEVVTLEADNEEQAKIYAKRVISGGGYTDEDEEIEFEIERIDEIPGDDEITAEVIVE